LWSAVISTLSRSNILHIDNLLLVLLEYKKCLKKVTFKPAFSEVPKPAW
jgi:hypothetical protein